MKFIHFLGSGAGSYSKKAIDYYTSLNKDHHIRLHDNIDSLFPRYAKAFKTLRSKFKTPRDVYFQQDLFKLSILRHCGGWWCNVFEMAEDPLDDIIKKHKLQNSFSYIQNGCNGKYILFIPKDWTGWKFCDNYLDNVCKKDFAPHSDWISNIIHTLSPLHPDIFKFIQSDKIVRLDMPRGENTMIDETKNSQRAINIMERFLAARDRWVAAGRPIRSEAEKKRIFEICKECPHIQKDMFGFKCGVCKCRLHDSRDSINKIAMSTECCADNPRRWDAEV